MPKGLCSERDLSSPPLLAGCSEDISGLNGHFAGQMDCLDCELWKKGSEKGEFLPFGKEKWPPITLGAGFARCRLVLRRTSAAEIFSSETRAIWRCANELKS